MKRTVATLSVILVLGTGQVLAQSSIVSQIAGDQAATERLYFSIKLGMSCGTLAGVEGAERLGGANVGLFATLKLGDRLSLVPEVTPVSRKGVTAISWLTTGDPGLDGYFDPPAKSALILNYVDIPVLVKYRLLDRIHLAAGPFVGFRTSAEERFRAELAEGEDMLYTRDATDAYRSLDYGVVLEASWVVTKPRRGEGLVFHLRYQAGLADILGDPAAAGAVRTSNVQVFVSFPFIHAGK